MNLQNPYVRSEPDGALDMLRDSELRKLVRRYKKRAGFEKSRAKSKATTILLSKGVPKHRVDSYIRWMSNNCYGGIK